MKNTEIFNDYDMVVSVSKRIINQELTHLTRMGVIHPEFVLTRTTDDDGNYQYTVLDSTDDIPKDAQGNPAVECIAGGILPQIEIGESGTNVTLMLNFRNGSAYFARGMRLHKYDMTGWCYGVVIDLDLKGIEKDDIGKNIQVPDLVKDQLYHFMDNMFTINHLFMDFESVDLLRFDPATTKTPDAPNQDSKVGDAGKQAFVEFMQFYLTGLVAKGNPFILGYSLATDSSTQYADDQKVPDELKPVGTTFSVYHDPDPANGDLSNLNFVLATKGGHGAIAGTPGNFDTNWLSPTDQCDAKMIYSHACLVEKFVLQPFYDKFSDQIYNGDPNDQDNHPGIKNNIDVPQGNAYATGKAVTATGFAYTISNITTGNDRYVNTYTVDVINDAAAATSTLKFSGTLMVYKESTTNLGVTTAEADATLNLAWSGTVVFATAKNAEGAPTVAITKAFQIDSQSSDSHMNDAAKAMAVIATIFGKILDFFTAFQDHDYFTNLFNSVMTAQVPGLGDVSLAFGNLGDAISTVLILPAGQVFYFKNPVIDPEANLSMLLTYKSDNAAPSGVATQTVPAAAQGALTR